MTPSRRRTVLFLVCAVVLLGAGFACGYIYSYNGFYSSEAQLDHELVEMDFNIRQLYYANLGRNVDCQRELVRQLRQQVTFVNQMLGSCSQEDTRIEAQNSVRQAKEVIGGRPILASGR